MKTAFNVKLLMSKTGSNSKNSKKKRKQSVALSVFFINKPPLAIFDDKWEAKDTNETFKLDNHIKFPFFYIYKKADTILWEVNAI